MLRLKVCCIQTAEEASLAIASGADALGLVSAMPSGPGVIDEPTIAAIARGVSSPVQTFLLTSKRSMAEIAAQHRRCGTTTIQLVDRLEKGTHAELRATLPEVRLVQVVHVTGPASIDEALAVAPQVDALLLDSGDPALITKQLGGTGRVHDWDLSRRIVDASPTPVYLAGGLRPDNVAEAVRTVRPYGVDVCSGVRTDGALDTDKLREFVAQLRGCHRR